MARYGTSTYNSGVYGAGSETNLLWSCEVDWDNDGLFDGRNEALNMTAFHSIRGRENFVQSDGNGFEPMQPGYCVFTLDNSSGDYDPYNTTSPLYPNVEPGKYIRIRVKRGDAAASPDDVFAGVIESIVPIGGIANPAVQITAYDGWAQLDESTITTTLNQNIQTGAAIEDALTRANYPAIWGYNIDAGADVIPFWWEDSIMATTAIDRLWQSEGGKAAVLADGSFRFYQRGASQTSALTIDQGVMLKDVQIPMPYSVVRNVVRVNVYQRIERASGDIWTLNEKPLVKAGESIELWGSYKYEDRNVSAIDVLTPTANTDYSMNTLVDGTGTDKTSDFTVTVSKFAESTKFVVTNNGVVDAYITLLKIRGNAIDAPDSTFVEEDNSGTGRKRLFTIDNPLIQTIAKAMAFVAYLGDILGSHQKYPHFQLESQPDYQFGFDLLDKITLTISKYGINADYAVSYIEHTWMSDNGQSVLTTVYTEPYVSQSQEDNYWIFTATFPMKFTY